MVTTSQVLTIIGLAFELISVFWTVRRLFYGYEKRIMGKAITFQQKIRRDRIEGIVVLLLLIAGMVLQGLAVVLTS